MPETVVYLVRHGQVGNPRRVLYGRLPGYHLSSRGQAQADLLARHFAEVPVAAVVASPWSGPSRRPPRSPPPTASGPHRPAPHRDEQHLRGGRRKRRLVHPPPSWWRLRDPCAPLLGERNVDMVERVHAVVDAVREEFAGRQVVLVSHQAPIWVARLAFERRRLTHWPGFRRCTLASVTTLAFDGDQLTRASYAEPAASALLGPAPPRGLEKRPDLVAGLGTTGRSSRRPGTGAGCWRRPPRRPPRPGAGRWRRARSGPLPPPGPGPAGGRRPPPPAWSSRWPGRRRPGARSSRAGRAGASPSR